VHFSIVPLETLNRGASYGQAHEQYLQPMHLPASIVTAPVRASFENASAGQCFKQGGSTQWLHATEWWNVGTPGT
jgi:hypothetical protein